MTNLRGYWRTRAASKWNPIKGVKYGAKTTLASSSKRLNLKIPKIKKRFKNPKNLRANPTRRPSKPINSLVNSRRINFQIFIDSRLSCQIIKFISILQPSADSVESFWMQRGQNTSLRSQWSAEVKLIAEEVLTRMASESGRNSS